MYPNIGLATRNNTGKIAVTIPLATSDIPSCLPNTGRNGSIGAIAGTKCNYDSVLKKRLKLKL